MHWFLFRFKNPSKDHISRLYGTSHLIGNILHNHLMARINPIIVSRGPIQGDHCLIPRESFLFALHQK